MTVQQLYTYVLKSSRGVSTKSVDVELTGFTNDRVIAVVNNSGRIVTGRSHPKLILISASIHENYASFTTAQKEKITFKLPTSGNIDTIKLFNNEVWGMYFSKNSSEWISSYLGGDYRFVFIGDSYNTIPKKRGGQKDEVKTYTDSSPIHVLNLATLKYLNTKLTSKVSYRNFRPNIIIDGYEPFQENFWREISINGVHFRLQEPTSRCIFTTIDPKTTTKDTAIEPLKTIAELNENKGGKPTFGINLVPVKTGIISIGDKVNIIHYQ